MKTLKNLLWVSAFLLCITSCSKDEVTERVNEVPENVSEVPEGKVLVGTEVVVDGVVQTNTRAASEAGYTTGDGLYDKDDPVTVTAVANDGYELTTFYDKQYPATNLGALHTFKAKIPQTFRAEFAKKYTITVSADPTNGGTVSGGGSYSGGKICTLTASPVSGYSFDGWYEGSTKVSSNASYSFTVSSNRTVTGKFTSNEPVIYITLMNNHWDDRDCVDIGYLTAPYEYNGELPNYTVSYESGYGVKTYAIHKQSNGNLPTFILANSYDDNEFLGWYDKDINLYSTNPQLSDQEITSNFAPGEHIYAAFTIRKVPSDKKCTIKINSRSDNGSLGGLIGFDSNSLERGEQTLVVNDGDEVTIYAEGFEGNDDSDFGDQPWWFYIKGFYSKNNIPLHTFNDVNKTTAQYTFVARSSQTIYVDFVYYRR